MHTTENGTSQSSVSNDIKNYLVEQYGPLLQIEEVAEVLRRKPKAIASALTSKSRQEVWVHKLREATVKIGRRRLFSAAGVASLIDG